MFQIVNAIDDGTISTIAQLSEKLQEIKPSNPDDSLAMRIRYMQDNLFLGALSEEKETNSLPSPKNS